MRPLVVVDFHGRQARATGRFSLGHDCESERLLQGKEGETRGTSVVPQNAVVEPSWSKREDDLDSAFGRHESLGGGWI
jgi:hypothetical protein